jgi:hypothetical protein
VTANCTTLAKFLKRELVKQNEPMRLVLVGAEGLEPPNLTDVNRAL